MCALVCENETFELRGAIFDVYREMGPGFIEPVYQECLEKELHFRGIPFQSHPDLSLVYKNERLSQSYRPDFVCYGKVILEIKAVKNLLPEHRAQLINYLKAAQVEIGLLVNFASYPKAEIERLVTPKRQIESRISKQENEEE
ncbi:MAG: GxxExxY protein [Verrucomicrobia bacterium]|nr:GxxExxY protein [Verrucomicrobiota bacterium]